MCALFNVSRSGYYSFVKRPVSKRELANKVLDTKIKSIYNQHKKRYGVPRITRVLQGQNESCSHTRVARRMQAMGLAALAKKKFKVTTDSEHNLPIYKNHLERNFSTTSINQKWACDITYSVPGAQGEYGYSNEPQVYLKYSVRAQGTMVH